MMNDIVTPKRDAHFFWTLFKSTFLISAFTVGGGFVIIPLLKGKYVDEYHWISDKDTLDMVAIAQSMPGVIAVNSAVILGYRMAGVLGTLVALVATVLPCLITLSIISYCYDFFIQNLYIKMILRGMRGDGPHRQCRHRPSHQAGKEEAPPADCHHRGDIHCQLML